MMGTRNAITSRCNCECVENAI